MSGSARVRLASDAYSKERLNCAQSVLRGFGASEARVAEAKAWGGGRSEGGLCGALFAACSLASSEEARERIAKAFAERAGSRLCREIRKLGKASCGDCVALAAELLEKEA